MSSENLQIDVNMRNVLGAVTNDSDEFIKNIRVNPITGAIVCEADVLSTNTSIGSTIPGGTAGSVLFLDVGTTLAEDNARFFWDATNHRLGLLNNTPTVTLSVGASEQFKVNSTGNITSINGVTTSFPSSQGGVSTYLRNDGTGTLTWAASTGSGYDLVQNNGSSVTQRSTINLSTLLTASDSGGKTALTINVVNLAGDVTFVTTLVANNTFTTALAGDSNFYTTLGANNSFVTSLTNNSSFQTAITNITTVNGAITVQEEGVSLSTAAAILNFVGAGVTATGTGTTKTITIPGGGSGTVTSVSVVSTNGFAGTVATATTTPAITLTTTATGLLQGNGTAISGITNSSTVGQVLRVTGASTYAWGAVDLADTDAVTGVLPIANLPAAATGLYSVSADETVITWYTMNVPILPDDYTTPTKLFGWSTTGLDLAGGQFDAGGYAQFISNAAMYSISLIPGISNNSNYTAVKDIRIKTRIRYSVVPGTENIGFGLVAAGATLQGDEDTVGSSVRFTTDNATFLYAITGDGAARTITDVSSGITVTNWNIYEIVFNPGVNAKFYINGVLVATHTTNLPTGSIPYVGYGSRLTGSTIETNTPVASIEL